MGDAELSKASPAASFARARPLVLEMPSRCLRLSFVFEIGVSLKVHFPVFGLKRSLLYVPQNSAHSATSLAMASCLVVLPSTISSTRASAASIRQSAGPATKTVSLPPGYAARRMVPGFSADEHTWERTPFSEGLELADGATMSSAPALSRSSSVLKPGAASLVARSLCPRVRLGTAVSRVFLSVAPVVTLASRRSMIAEACEMQVSMRRAYSGHLTLSFPVSYTQLTASLHRLPLFQTGPR